MGRGVAVRRANGLTAACRAPFKVPARCAAGRLGRTAASVQRIRNAIQSLAWRFNADRMLEEYAAQCYLPLIGGRAEKRPS